MLSVEGHLPPGALLDAQARPLTAAMADMGALWFSFDSALADLEGDVITGLHSRTGTAHARPTEANTGNGRLLRHRGAEVLSTQPRVNCGFVLSERVECATIGVACVFDAPGGKGETLWCVDARKGDSGVVLTEEGGALRLGDRRGEDVLTRPLRPGGGMQLAFATVTPDTLSLMVEEQPPATGRFEGSFAPGPCDVYLACRRGRQGLLNTLGDLRLADVLLFPDRDICAPDARGLRDRLRAYVDEVFHGV
ncbi:hypothetical protein [Oceaniglobus trochenteri]|uniref:hypothetical protein n=1 Tax=Oceaniglobus trochenteri TaxID=2763260 RepID=UPI001CFF68CC|nr:hypothetical protein [Oceaniglobus trochenteri]